MSHFTVLVIGDDYESQLAPYDESIQVAPYRSYESEDFLERTIEAFKKEKGRKPKDDNEIAKYMNKKYEDDGLHYGADENGVYYLTTYNKSSKWDWYQVGGRWRGYFKLKASAMDAPVLAEVGPPGVFDNDALYDADVVTKGNVDAEAMRDEAGERAGERWDRAHAVIDGTPEPEPWDSVRQRFENIDEAREFYRQQERIEKVREHDELCRKEERHDETILGFMDGIEQYSISRDEYVQKARDGAICPFAYVYRGEWLEPGSMGWWGISTDTEESRLKFQKEFNELFDSLPDDTQLTLCDCHI